jgi:hypothetical protein
MLCRLAILLTVLINTLLLVVPQTNGQGKIPNRTYPGNELFKSISPAMGKEVQNQPAILNGAVVVGGSGLFRFYDIADPYRPQQLGMVKSSVTKGEAESHHISFATWGGRFYAVTISGIGVDIWDWTDMRNPQILNNMRLEGINHGDDTNIAWGVSWQAPFIYVGGTNTGLHVINATDPKNPKLVKRMPTSQLGGVSAGPLFAIGNLLVITVPKNSTGVVTLDISNPENPILLDFDKRVDPSYIGWYHQGHIYQIYGHQDEGQYLLIHDVLTDPRNIKVITEPKLPHSEYMNFQGDIMFLGTKSPGGFIKYDVSNYGLKRLGSFRGRNGDDQFLAVAGNLVVVSDDETKNGSLIVVHDIQPDKVAPAVHSIIPKPGSTSQSLTSRIGFSFTEGIELNSLSEESIVVRPLGGEPLKGRFSGNFTVINFSPAEPLKPNTTYEVLLPAGGVKDYVGNGISQQFRALFSTGSAISDTQHGETASIELKSGWNLISLPIQPNSSSIESVLNSLGGLAAVYAFQQNAYKTYIPGNTGNDLTQMRTGVGYWVYVERDSSLRISGRITGHSIALEAGWNLVGYTRTTSMETGRALQSLSGVYEAVYGFDPAANSYKGFVPSIDETSLSRLEPTRGYWIYASTKATWTLN